MNIHPLAVVSPQANIGRDVRIAAFAIVEDEVSIGEGSTVASHAVIKSGTEIGPRNTICESAVIGGLPQHTRCPSDIGGVRIGAGNTLREFCTVHRAIKPGAYTTVADNNYFMAGVHIAHDCVVGSNIIMANNALLGGHVTVDDRAFVSGAVAVHQFCRIGKMAMLGGHARVVRDVPPFVTVDGISGDVVGLNIVGLKRNGFSQDQINILKAAYRVIYRSGLPWSQMLGRLAEEFVGGPAAVFHEFLSGGTRGFSQERRPSPHVTTLKIRKEADDAEPQSAEPIAVPLAKAG